MLQNQKWLHIFAVTWKEESSNCKVLLISPNYVNER